MDLSVKKIDVDETLIELDSPVKKISPCLSLYTSYAYLFEKPPHCLFVAADACK